MLLWLARSGSLVVMIAAIQLFNEMVSKFFWVLQLRCDAYIQDERDALDGFGSLL